jgi:hypothetical protein
MYRKGPGNLGQWKTVPVPPHHIIGQVVSDLLLCFRVCSGAKDMAETGPERPRLGRNVGGLNQVAQSELVPLEGQVFAWVLGWEKAQEDVARKLARNMFGVGETKLARKVMGRSLE